MQFDLPVSTYLVVLKVTQSHQLDRSPGYVWRGKLGTALQRVSCLQPTADACDVCDFAATCAYGQLYTQALHPFLETKSRATVPSPYIVAPQHDQQLRAGQIIQLFVTLVGQANIYYPQLLAALRTVAAAGLSSQRIPLEVLSLNQLLPTGDLHILQEASVQQRALPPSAIHVPTVPAYLKVSLQSPTRLLKHGRLYDESALTGAHWAQAVIRRVADLSRAWGGGYLSIGEALRAADDITTLDNNLKVVRQYRRSARQKKQLDMSGVCGDLFLQLNASTEKIWPALWLGQWLHLGKGAVMGQGQYELLPAADYRGLLQAS